MKFRWSNVDRGIEKWGYWLSPADIRQRLPSLGCFKHRDVLTRFIFFILRKRITRQRDVLGWPTVLFVWDREASQVSGTVSAETRVVPGRLGQRDPYVLISCPKSHSSQVSEPVLQSGDFRPRHCLCQAVAPEPASEVAGGLVRTQISFGAAENPLF